MIDFILGDDGTAEEKLGETLFTKYTSATVELLIGDQTFTVQRRWHDAGAKTKIFVGEAALNIPEFRQLMLDQLGIPSLHYPQGNPYGVRTWPELGFRSLFRHMYRRQCFWGDLADQQITSEQHACILQFLGMAEKLYSQEYGDLVKAQKTIAELEATRDSFQCTLNEISREIVSEEEARSCRHPRCDFIGNRSPGCRDQRTQPQEGRTGWSCHSISIPRNQRVSQGCHQ